MTDDTRFNPHLGRIGHRRANRPDTQLGRLAKTARRGQPRGQSQGQLKPGTVRYQGRGKAAAAMARHWSHARQRRVVVKVHIARAGIAGNAAFAKHLAYIQRDGTERDGSRGSLYDREGEVTDAKAFNTRAREDQRQFRLIVSPEDAGRIKDLTAFTRSFMDQAEKDLGKRLDWVAINHHDTAHPHVHIVIRGGNTRNGELIIDRKYITHGLRHRAEEEVTREFGQRRLREIAASRSRDAERDALTSIDRELQRAAPDGRLELTCESGVLDRFDGAVKARRLAHLEKLGLAQHVPGLGWQLKEGWDDTLRALGRRGDIINTMARAMGRRLDMENVREFSPTHAEGGEITGRLSAILPGDELRNGRTLVVEGIDGHQWTADVSESQMPELPRIGGVISLSAAKLEPKPADRTIAMIAERNGGVYSETLHEATDPASSPAFRLAHKRRLEALRRLGGVKRHKDGSWQVPHDLEQRALEAETRRGRFAISVRSWLPIEQLTEQQAHTWLDQLDERELTALGTGFGAEVRAARIARLSWSEAEGLNLRSGKHLETGELQEALAKEAARSSKAPMELAAGEIFKGVYTRNIDLAQGRFAVIENEGQFLLAGWSARNAAWRGREVTLHRSGRAIQWQLGRGQTIGH